VNRWIQQLDGLYPLQYFLWMWHYQHALVSTVHIPSHAIKVQHVQFSEYLLIKNYMAVKSLFYYHSKYLNSMKCREISMGPSIHIIQIQHFATVGSAYSEK
jgi:hypothetical protein